MKGFKDSDGEQYDHTFNIVDTCECVVFVQTTTVPVNDFTALVTFDGGNIWLDVYILPLLSRVRTGIQAQNVLFYVLLQTCITVGHMSKEILETKERAPA